MCEVPVKLGVHERIVFAADEHVRIGRECGECADDGGARSEAFAADGEAGRGTEEHVRQRIHRAGFLVRTGV